MNAVFDDSLSDDEIAALGGSEFEAAVRRKWGYTSSETRSEAERHAAAERMLARSGPAALSDGSPLGLVRGTSVFHPDPKPGKR